MTKIHMQVEQTRQSASRMQRSALELSESCDVLHRARRRLAGSWSGGDSRHFDRDLRNCLNQLENHIEDLDRLFIRMQREIDQWEAEDNDGLDRLPINFKPPSIGDIIDTGIKVGISIIIGDIVGGINTIVRAGGKWIEDNVEEINEVINRSDEAIDDYLKNLIGGRDGTTESIRISGDVEFTIPGAEVGVPGSFVVGGGKDYDLIRNPDGTYTVRLIESGTVGLKHDFTPNAEIRVGDFEGKFGPSAEVGAYISPISTVGFTFDPEKTGDMTKMIALLGSIGATLPGALSGMPLPTAGPPLYLLKDNLSEIGMSTEGAVEGEISANALIKLAGADAEAHAKSGSTLIKENGKWKSVSEVEVGGEINADLLSKHEGLEQNINIKSVTDLETGQSTSVVTVTLKAEQGAGLDKSVVKAFTGQDVAFEVNEVGEIEISYTLDQPAETVKDMIIGPDGPSIDPLLKNSSIDVSTSQGVSAGTGAGGNINAGAGQEIGVSGDVGLSRSSKRTYHVYP